MPYRCCVTGCNGNYDNGPRVRVFSFPKNDDRKRLWLRKIPRANFEPSDSSREKNSFLNYNVSCILTLPPYQRQGYGRLLIDFSYLLTRVERKVGSPEKPLSDLGLISYRSYWKDVLLQYLCNFGGKDLSVKDISQEMAINSYDIVSTLQALGMMKYWKGKHIILKKQDVIDEYKERMKRRGSVYKEIDPAFLRWTPFVAPSPAGAT